MNEITISATLDNLDDAIGFVASLDMGINIAVEEIFVNICNYAYADSGASGNVTIRTWQKGDIHAIEFEDSGVPYNPLDKGEPDDLDAETSAEKNVGGYGIYMVRQIMDSVSYHREGSKNILTITKKVEDD